MRVLIVDDSAVMCKIMVNALADAGITETSQAKDGRMAVMEVAENDFDLVLMDWNMPNMTGIEALRVIRSVGKKVPVIMVTTETDKDRIVEAIKAGANQYIFKPFKPKMLLNKIHQVIAEVPK